MPVKKLSKAWTKAELKKFLDIITGRQKEDVFSRLTKAASPKATDEPTTVRRLCALKSFSDGEQNEIKRQL